MGILDTISISYSGKDYTAAVIPVIRHNAMISNLATKIQNNKIKSKKNTFFNKIKSKNRLFSDKIKSKVSKKEIYVYKLSLHNCSNMKKNN